MVTILPPQSVLRASHKTAQSMPLRSRTQPLKMRVRAAPFPPTPAPNSARTQPNPRQATAFLRASPLRHRLYAFQRCVPPNYDHDAYGVKGRTAGEPPQLGATPPSLGMSTTVFKAHMPPVRRPSAKLPPPGTQTLPDPARLPAPSPGRPQDRYHHLHDLRQASHRDSRRAGSVLRHVQAPTTTMKSHGRCRGSLQSSGLRNVPILVARIILAAQGGTLDASNSIEID